MEGGSENVERKSGRDRLALIYLCDGKLSWQEVLQAAVQAEGSLRTMKGKEGAGTRSQLEDRLNRGHRKSKYCHHPAESIYALPQCELQATPVVLLLVEVVTRYALS